MRQFDRPDPSTDPPPIDAYLATALTIYLGDVDVLVTPVNGGVGTTQRGVKEFTGADVVHLITAANPYSQELAEAENAARNAAAGTVLEDRGLRHAPAVGMDLERTWVEPGFALFDVDEAVVLQIAERWSQHGIYRWDADGWWLVLTDGSPPVPFTVEVTTR